MPSETLRVPLNLAWADALKAFLQAQTAGAPPPGAIEQQVQGLFQGGYQRDLGLLRYAAGAPLAQVRELLRRASEYHLEVFRLRDEDEEPSEASLTNSHRGAEAMELALACGALDVARSLAPLVHDRPDASYLGPGSVVCTPEEQHLAYALRDLLLGHPDEGLAQVRAIEEVSLEQADRLAVLNALARKDAKRFTWALGELHQRHLDRVGHPGLLDTLEDLLDLPTLAYAALGHLVFPELKPLPSDPFLPLELCQVAEETP